TARQWNTALLRDLHTGFFATYSRILSRCCICHAEISDFWVRVPFYPKGPLLFGKVASLNPLRPIMSLLLHYDLNCQQTFRILADPELPNSVRYLLSGSYQKLNLLMIQIFFGPSRFQPDRFR